jgi:hypothetical protein
MELGLIFAIAAFFLTGWQKALVAVKIKTNSNRVRCIKIL